MINEKLISDYLYYKDGDTFTTNTSYNFAGHITASSAIIYLTLPLPKRLDNISSITFNTFKVVGRGINGYINSSATYTDITISPYTINTVGMYGNWLYLEIVKSSAFTNVTNNTPVILQIQSGFSITFNE